MIEATKVVFLRKGGWLGVVILLAALVWYVVTGGSSPTSCLVATRFFSEVWWLLGFFVLATGLMAVVLEWVGNGSISTVFFFVLVCAMMAGWNVLACGIGG